ncbi:MAG: hypothetical protein RLZZ450_1888, partial [Pseudomonadota bacterium]
QVARIDVIDDGPGIAASERERVFVPFYRSPEARASGASGHGIGLSLIARVAWQHDGKVELVERAHGTHLSVTLPTWHAPLSNGATERALSGCQRGLSTGVARTTGRGCTNLIPPDTSSPTPLSSAQHKKAQRGLAP